MIRSVTNNDAEQVAKIYNYYVLNTAVTFEEQAVTSAQMAQRFDEISDAGLPWLVIEADGELVGFAYASNWKGRCAYKYSVEVTVYLKHGSSGDGLGSQLYTELFSQLRAKGIHIVLGGISLPNQPSIALHEKFGMKKVAHFEEVGYKFDRWVDVAYWQAKL